MGDHVPDFPPLMTGGEIRVIFLNFAQAMTSQANSVISQVQAMMAQENRRVRPRVTHKANTMASRLRDFTIMSPPMFFWSR